MVLEVEQLHPGVAEGQVVAGTKGLEQAVLDHPVDLSIELQWIVLDGADAVLPHLQRLLLQGGEALGVGVAQGPVEVLALDVERAHFATVGEAYLAATGDVVADVADRADRVLEGHVAQHDRGIFEHAQHARRRADLDEGRVLAHVAVADDHM